MFRYIFLAFDISKEGGRVCFFLIKGVPVPVPPPLFLVANLAFFLARNALPHTKCERTWEKVGCFRENIRRNRRTVPVLLISDRDPRSRAFDGHRIDWHAWEESTLRYVCLLLITYNFFQIKGW